MTSIDVPRDHTRAMWCHLSAFTGIVFFIPFANIIGPLIVWQTAPVKDPEIERAGKEAVNFQITMSAIAIAVYLVSFVVTLIAAIAIPQTKSGGFAMIGISIFEMIAYAAVVVLWLVFVITAGMRASQGLEYRYPMAVRLVK